MTSKEPANSTKKWSPSDKLSIDKAIRKDNPANARPVEDTHLSHPARGQQPRQPTNSKPFNRQKKG